MHLEVVFKNLFCYQLLFQSTRHYDYYAEWDKHTTTRGGGNFNKIEK